MTKFFELARSPKAAPWALGARLLLGVVLALSGFFKLMAPAEELALTMEGYRLLEPGRLMTFARVLPWVELLVGVYLFVGYSTRLMSVLAGGLFATFIFAIVSALARGIALADCGCFGRGGPHLSPPQAAAMDVVLLLLCAAVFYSPQKFAIDNWLNKTPSPKKPQPSK